MLVIGVLTTLGLVLLGVPLALALGLLAGLLAFIPNLGPILAVIPAVLPAFLDSPAKAFHEEMKTFRLTKFLLLMERRLFSLGSGRRLAAQRGLVLFPRFFYRSIIDYRLLLFSLLSENGPSDFIFSFIARMPPPAWKFFIAPRVLAESGSRSIPDGVVGKSNRSAPASSRGIDINALLRTIAFSAA